MHFIFYIIIYAYRNYNRYRYAQTLSKREINRKLCQYIMLDLLNHILHVIYYYLLRAVGTLVRRRSTWASRCARKLKSESSRADEIAERPEYNNNMNNNNIIMYRRKNIYLIFIRIFIWYIIQSDPMKRKTFNVCFLFMHTKFGTPCEFILFKFEQKRHAIVSRLLTLFISTYKS